MQIQVHTDNHIEGSSALAGQVEAEVESALERFGTRITRVEVHLGDDNGAKRSDNDKRCRMEARVAGLDPIAASHNANSLEDALAGAVATLRQNLQRTFDKLGQKKGRTSYSGDEMT